MGDGSTVRDAAGGAVLRVYQRPDGRWGWCYHEPGGDVWLHSNQDYASREEAVISARRAYPDVPFSPETPGEGDATGVPGGPNDGRASGGRRTAR